MKTIILHIGQTKTATTSVQTFLADNRSKLAGLGVLYPEVPPDHPAKHQHRFLVESLHSAPKHAEAAWDFLLQTVAESQHPRVLISEEVFWHLHEAQPARRRVALEWMHRKMEGHALRIVVYLRRQDAWVESWHNQLAKTDVSAMSALGLDDFVLAQQQLGMLDYAHILEDWATVFGIENIAVREFRDDLLLHGDAVADFMHHALGLDSLSEFGPVGEHQRALGQAALSFALRFNRMPHAERFKVAHKQMLRNANPLLEDRRSRLSTARAHQLWEDCRDSNMRVAERFGLRQGLFSDWSLRDPGEAASPAGARTLNSDEAVQAAVDLSQADTLALMAQMFQRFEERANRMQKRIEQLEAQLKSGSEPEASP
jgi:hypothetical protein